MVKEKRSEAAKGWRMLLTGLIGLPVCAVAWVCIFTLVPERYLQTAAVVAYFASLITLGMIACAVLILAVEAFKSIRQRREMTGMRRSRGSPAVLSLVIGLVLAGAAGVGWLVLPKDGSFDSNLLLVGWMTVFATWGAGLMLMASAVIAVAEKIRTLTPRK